MKLETVCRRVRGEGYQYRSAATVGSRSVPIEVVTYKDPKDEALVTRLTANTGLPLGLDMDIILRRVRCERVLWEMAEAQHRELVSDPEALIARTCAWYGLDDALAASRKSARTIPAPRDQHVQVLQNAINLFASSNA